MILYSIFIIITLFALNQSVIIQRRPPDAQSTSDGDSIDKLIAPFQENISLRLPNDTHPITYDIQLTTRIDQQNFTFDGFVRIEINIVTDTNQIVLHMLDLNIETVDLSTTDSEPISTTYDYDDEREFLIIYVSEGLLLLAHQHFYLDIKYNGELSTGTRGFYRSFYVNASDENVYLATTQFQPSSARQAFPCYDEPAIKARFNITIIHGRNYTAISNMPVVMTSNVDETTRTTFDQTPIMSTYLIAFVISDFEHILNTSNGMTHRSFARPTAIAEAQLSLKASIPILEAIEEYLTIPYTLPKIDQITIPHFAAGAMENWGLVTYSERYFLFNENETYYDDLTEIILTISHEYIHQWFGNLVTTNWWSQTWLNEGFANYFEYYITNLVFPEWKMMEYFVYNNLQTVLISDANANTLPMSYYIERREDISGRFNYVSYAKSGSVIRMFVNAFSDETFTQGLIYHLNDKQFTNAVEEDLFENLQLAVSNDQMLADELSVHDIFSSWTQQPGYPLLTVTRNYAENIIQLSQERYLTESNDTLSIATWWIPYNYATSIDANFSSTLPMGWFTRNQTMLLPMIPDITNNDWIIFNKQATGYYRVQYDIENWQLIANQLNSIDYRQIHLYSRSQLIDDSFIFARTNRLPWNIPLDILTYLSAEFEYVPWASANRHLQYLTVYMRALKNYAIYTKFIRDRIAHAFTYIGINDIEGETHLNKYLRTIAINLACTYGLENCIDSTYETVKNIVETNHTVHQNLRNVLYCGAMRKNDIILFTNLLTNIIQSNQPLYRNQLLRSLGCTTDNWLHDILFIVAVTAEVNFTIAERSLMFSSIYQNSLEGVSSSLKFLKSDMDNIYTVYTEVEFNNHLNELSKVVTTEVQLNEYKELLEIYRSKEYANETVIATATNQLSQTENWLNTNLKSIEDWLDAYENSNQPSTISPPPTDEPVTQPPTDDPGAAITINLSKLVMFLTILISIKTM